MLKSLEIQNVALIDKLSIEFCNNLNVLSGETGAGKSIVIDSLNFVIGGKTSKNLIKQDCDFMQVKALFCNDISQKLMDILKEYEIEVDDEILLQRKMTIDGKTQTKINGCVLTNSMLKNISSLLIDIHGQHEHQHLLQDKFHLQIIDNFIKDKSLFFEFEKKNNELKQINVEIKKLNGSTQNQERMLDLLDYQIKEITNAEIKPQEDEILQQKKIIMQNSEKIYDNITNSLILLDGGQTSVVDLIKKSINSIKNLIKFDEEYEKLSDRLDSTKYEIIDILQNLQDKKEQCNFDQFEFDKIDERLDKLTLLKKKYGPSLDDVNKFLSEAKEEYNKILNSKEILINLLDKKKNIVEQLYAIGKSIHDLRETISKKFENEVMEELKDLGMKNSKLKVDFNEFPTFDNCEDELTDNGFDKVKFMFSANLGQNLKPLSEIISGGEASRFMLALKNILASFDNIGSMVFDEIDVGISGDMGYKVACKMANISKNHQVMAVSHLPQICAMADNNIKVEKIDEENKTVIKIKQLTDKTLLNEIARLSGGIADNTASIEHAVELKNRCNYYKQSL